MWGKERPTLENDSSLTSPANAFTVDLEEWYQGLTSTNLQVERWPTFESRLEPAAGRLLAILDEHGVRATFFVLGLVADQHPNLIEAILAEGHEVGIHGYYHRFVWSMTPDEFAQELDMSLAAVERIAGQRPVGHRAPYFSINAKTPWAFEALRTRGLRYDSSVFPVRNMVYGYPGGRRFPYRTDDSGNGDLSATEHRESGFVEFPLSTVRLGGVNWPIAGGFYLRALPYAFIRWGVKRLNRQGQPAIMYMHPWELDTGQRYKQVTARERVSHYTGRRGLEEKLHRLLTDFHFGPLCELVPGVLRLTDR